MASFWVESLIRPDDLEGYPSTEILVEADEDRAHSPLPELPDHPEVTHMRRVYLCGLLIRHICILC
jgi:hypothetical protein